MTASQPYLYIVKMEVLVPGAAVKANLYSVKIVIYKFAHAKNTQSGQKQGAGTCKTCGARKKPAKIGAKAAANGRFGCRCAVSPRFAARGAARSRRARARTRRAGWIDAARGGARGGRIPCRAQPSFRRPCRFAERTRRGGFSPIQRRDGRGRRFRFISAGEGVRARQGLCRVCAGSSRDVWADVPQRASGHVTALAL